MTPTPIPPHHDGRRRPAPRPYPATVEDRLLDVLRRLGRIEAMLIDLRDANAATDADKPKYYIDRDLFR
jgi:hypothetical protein